MPGASPDPSPAPASDPADPAASAAGGPPGPQVVDAAGAAAVRGDDGRPAHPLPTLRQAAVLVVKGVCMGTADVIPGVSGGTVALILGVYARLIEGIKSFDPRTVLALLTALPGMWDAGRRPAFVAAARALHLDFLIPLGAGIASAILVAARIIPPLMKSHPAEMSALFFGLILASVYVPLSMIRSRSVALLLPAAVLAGLAFYVVGLPFLQGEASLPFIFLCGAVAICAMILPGVSGSYMLKALGQYENILTALHERDLVTVVVFMAGMATGIVLFVRVLSFLLRRYPSTTLAGLTGMMLGSLRSVWPFKQVEGESTVNVWPASFGGHELLLCGIALVGVAVVAGLIVVDTKLSRGQSGAEPTLP